MTGRLLIVWLSCIGAVAEADGPKPAKPDWWAAVRKLDQADPAVREKALWRLVERHRAARDELAALARDKRTSAQTRWALRRAVRFIGRGYTWRFWRLAGDYLAGYEALPWRARRLRLTRMVVLASTTAYEPLLVVEKQDKAPQVRRYAHRLVAQLALERARTRLNKALKARQYPVALEILARLVRRFPDQPEIHYKQGCVFSLAGRAPEAILALEKAIAHGFNHVDRLENDPDLANIRKLRQFKALKKKIK